MSKIPYAAVLSSSELNDKLTLPDGTNIYFDMKDGTFGYNTDPERGADTFHPFTKSSSLPEDLRFYSSRSGGSILSFRVQGKTKLTFSLNTRYSSTQNYPSMDYLTIYDGQPKNDDSEDMTSGLNSIGTLTSNGMSIKDASSYLKKCTSGYITLKSTVTSANAAKCFIKDIVLE